MKINDIINEGYFVLPTMDRERYTDLSKEGLEGPFMTRSGKVVYYDPKEGKYYDRDSDMYLSHEEYEAYDSPQTNVNESVIINEAPYQVISLEGNILRAIPQGGEQEIRIDISGMVLEFGASGPVLRPRTSPMAKDRSLAPGSSVDVQGNPRIIGTPKKA
jgi:hypothetical protein